ncbi:MBL fold metallo-hydrolase [Actinoallomurus spadix]|uniref:MBL fold metallo-hydrolase n=1 Tax=Actinoallomurus spadix TaxID=79912 RepID=UPI00209319DE|nr:MBL fold metallo-hydrolase [Actinoallomurus spadix]MCO5987834.1 MBL fold metallo-hydrolase [Actinoallomurus spadix]
MVGKRVDRRRFLRGATVGATVATAAATGASGAPASGERPKARRAGGTSTAVTFRWFGTAGWRIDIGSRTLLVDPYLSRYDTGLFRGAFDPATELTVDTATVGENVGRPETVLVTHAHWDHFNDVPYIARTTGARVIGTMTTCNLALASDVPSGRLGLVKGGEVLDFGDYTVEVVASLHSRNAAYSVGLPGVRLTRPDKPRTVADLPEGDTLAYQVTVKGGPSVFFMGGSDFVERNVAGLSPDVAMIAMQASDATHAYAERIVTALGRPSVIVPVHWDDFETPLTNPPKPDPQVEPHLDAFVSTVRKVSPRSEIVLPSYLTPYHFA